jgi:hypothetical protein
MRPPFRRRKHQHRYDFSQSNLFCLCFICRFSFKIISYLLCIENESPKFLLNKTNTFKMFRLSRKILVRMYVEKFMSLIKNISNINQHRPPLPTIYLFYFLACAQLHRIPYMITLNAGNSLKKNFKISYKQLQ